MAVRLVPRAQLIRAQASNVRREQAAKGQDKLKPADGANYRPDVDGLRALAVACVVVFHAFPKTLPGGYVGVDVFFVISGYLISGIILHGLRSRRFSYLDFYARRIRRIFPALITVLLSSIVAGWYLLLPDDFKELGKEAAAGAGFSANLLFFSQSGYFDVSASTKPLLHLWSLGVEEQFYLAWPLLLAFTYQRARSLLPLIVGIILGSFALNVALTPQYASASFYLPFTRFWELLLGALLVYRESGAERTANNRSVQGDSGVGWPRLLPNVLAGLGVALVGSCVWLLDSDSAFPGWWALLPAGGTGCLLAARGSWLNRVLLSNRVLVFIGLISYPLYLWHWVILAFIHLRTHDGSAFAPAYLRLAAVALSVLLAWSTYVLVEQPVRFRPHPFISPVALLVLMGLTGLVSLSVDLSDGGAWRYPPEIRPLVALNYDRQRDEAENAYRADRCFLGRTQVFSDLVPDCIDGGSPGPSTPLVALWGDSHAASLYPGLKALRERTHAFRIAQFTASLCPPLLGKPFPRRPNCMAFNSAVYAKLTELRPEVVILMGHWRNYATNNSQGNELDLQALSETVTRLKQIGVRRVVVIGCLPEWSIAQPKVSVRLWHDTGHTVVRDLTFLNPTLAGLDERVRTAALGADATFVAPMTALCNVQGCLLTSNANGAPIAWDTAHLTATGSDYVVDSLAAEIFGVQPVKSTEHTLN